MQNSSPQQFQTIRVTCHSGRSYADRPTSLVWNGERYEITEIEREWLEPDGKHFIVQATGTETPRDAKRFEICYYTKEDLWRLNEIL
jgi:hypothetical protein